ncbi:MAG: hypothetical protein RL247_777 [Actinomycetota bacterium]|jgi:hypothetical protein
MGVLLENALPDYNTQNDKYLNSAGTNYHLQQA